MKKVPTPTEKSQKERSNTKTAYQNLQKITQWLCTDLGLLISLTFL